MPSIWLGNETKNGNKQQKSFILQTANFWWAIRNYLLWATLNFYSVHLRYKLNFAQRIKSKCFINNSSNAKNMMHSCKFLSSSVELFRLRCVWFFQNIFKIIHSLFAKWIKSLMLTNWFVFLRKWIWPTCLPVSWGPGPVSAGSRTALLAGTPPCAPPPTAPATPPPPPRCAPPHSSHPAWTEHTTYQFYITIARALINKKSRFLAFPTERLSHPSASKTVVHMYTQNVFFFLRLAKKVLWVTLCPWEPQPDLQVAPQRAMGQSCRDSRGSPRGGGRNFHFPAAGSPTISPDRQQLWGPHSNTKAHQGYQGCWILDEASLT